MQNGSLIGVRCQWFYFLSRPTPYPSFVSKIKQNKADNFQESG